jgi:hypothetical protein
VLEGVDVLLDLELLLDVLAVECEVVVDLVVE